MKHPISNERVLGRFNPRKSAADPALWQVTQQVSSESLGLRLETKDNSGTLDK